jgi:hypothetical protein
MLICMSCQQLFDEARPHHKSNGVWCPGGGVPDTKADEVINQIVNRVRRAKRPLGTASLFAYKDSHGRWRSK